MWRCTRAENVCSDPDILAKEIEHLNKVLHYNNYPQWMINQWGKVDKQDPLIHPETGNEIKKRFYISVPYFPWLSESYKKIFKYMPIQVCFKGVNTLKSMLMHPKDRVSSDQKKRPSLPLGMQGRWMQLLIHWRKPPGPLVRRSKNTPSPTTSAILKHCKDFHHPLPSIADFNIIDKEPSQITWEAKEAIHIRWLDPSLNRNIGKNVHPTLLWPPIRCKNLNTLKWEH